MASGRNSTKPADNTRTVRTESVPARTSRTPRATTYASTSAVAITRPCDRCADATCPHANAESASHGSRRHPAAEKNPLAPTNTSGVHASDPANGRLIATTDAEIPSAIASPPAVAATRPTPSLRRNHRSPRPARIGFSTISARRPPPHPNSHESAIVGAYNQPLCGSAANGVPTSSCGFQVGTVPFDSASPSRHERGSQKDRMSGCWSVRFGRNAMPLKATSTDPMIKAGPAAAARNRRVGEEIDGCGAGSKARGRRVAVSIASGYRGRFVPVEQGVC